MARSPSGVGRVAAGAMMARDPVDEPEWEKRSDLARAIWLDATEPPAVAVPGPLRGTPVCWRCGAVRDEGRSECDECERRTGS